MMCRMAREMEPTVTRATVRAKGQLTLPQVVREALHIGEDDQVEFSVDRNGDVTLRGMRTVPTDQAWFWTADWQDGELEASDQIKNGIVQTFDSDDDFRKALGG